MPRASAGPARSSTSVITRDRIFVPCARLMVSLARIIGAEIMGHLLAAGQRAEVFEWGSRVIKLHRSTTAKQVMSREAAIHASVEALGLPVPTVWSVQQVGGRWDIVFDRVSGVSFAEQMRGDAWRNIPVSSDPRAPAYTHSCPPRGAVQQPKGLAGYEHRPNRASRRATKADLARRPHEHA